MNPVAFSIFGMEVRWYGILIGIGMVIGILISYKRADSFGIKPDKVIDFALFFLPAAVIGARVWYVAFNWELYKGDWLKIINLKLGGLAFHGGIIFAIITVAILCKIWGIKLWDLLDLLAPAVALGQAIGRWGNFINKEAYGIATNVPWAIEINGQMVHPTFLYESIWCLFLFILLLKLSPKRKFSGQIILLYGMLYSVERLFVEGLRTDSLYFMGLRTAQLISVLAIVLCLILYIYRKKCSRD